MAAINQSSFKIGLNSMCRLVTRITLILLFSGLFTTTKAQSNWQELIVCGWDEVFILDMSDSQNDRPRKVWSWQAKDRLELPS